MQTGELGDAERKVSLNRSGYRMKAEEVRYIFRTCDHPRPFAPKNMHFSFARDDFQRCPEKPCAGGVPSGGEGFLQGLRGGSKGGYEGCAGRVPRGFRRGFRGVPRVSRGLLDGFSLECILDALFVG